MLFNREEVEKSLTSFFKEAETLKTDLPEFTHHIIDKVILLREAKDVVELKLASLEIIMTLEGMVRRNELNIDQTKGLCQLVQMCASILNLKLMLDGLTKTMSKEDKVPQGQTVH